MNDWTKGNWGLGRGNAWPKEGAGEDEDRLEFEGGPVKSPKKLLPNKAERIWGKAGINRAKSPGKVN
jgi:hypothetical protein